MKIAVLCQLNVKKHEYRTEYMLGSDAFIEINVPYSKRQRYLQHFDLSVVLATIPLKLQIKRLKMKIDGFDITIF